MGCVYLAKNKINGKCYVGKTTRSLDYRLTQHSRDSKNNSQFYFHKAIRKYEIVNFEWSVLKESDDNNILNEFEKYFIKELNTKKPFGYNLTDGGDGTPGLIVSEESRLQRSIKTRGKKHRPHTEETKIKISQSHKGIKFSSEHCENIRKAKTGIKLSDETKRKIGLAGLGKKMSEEAKEKIRKAHIGMKVSDEAKEKLRLYNLGNKHSEETKAKMSASRMGRIESEETRKKISIANKGKPSNWRGRHHSEETKAKMRAIAIADGRVPPKCKTIN